MPGGACGSAASGSLLPSRPTRIPTARCRGSRMDKGLARSGGVVVDTSDEAIISAWITRVQQ